MLALLLYAAGVAALLALGALAAERALRLAGRATRWAWVAGMIGAIALPVAAWLRPAAPTPVATREPGALAAGSTTSLEALLARAQEVVPAAPAWTSLERPLLVAWALVSAVLVARLVVGLLALRRAARRWEPAVVGGERVLLSRDVGPAVVGVRRGVVLPRWALRLDAEKLALLLAHEREHVRARDPWLLHAATLAAALLPWSPALWWMRRRLRLAVEIDCDRRVLRRHPGVAAYGALLLEVGRRAAGAPAFPMAALLVPASALERRIRDMTMRRPRRHLLRAAALAAGSALVLVVACETPRPTAPVSPDRDVPLASLERSAVRVSADGRVSVEETRAAIARHAPALLELRSGVQQHVVFVVDSSGAVIRADFRPSTGSDEEADPRVRFGHVPDVDDIASVEIVKHPAGRVAPDPVGAVWIFLKGSAEDGQWRRQGRAGELSVATERAAAGGTHLRVLQGAEGPPLFLVDGVEVSEDALRALSPDRIAAVDVVKGSAATAEYGERGRNGVVRITTRTP